MNGRRFTQLFSKPRGNHGEICEGLLAIAQHQAGGIAWRCSADEDDAVHDSLVVAIKAIRKFDLTRSRNAFSYFSEVIGRELRRQLLRQHLHPTISLEAAGIR